MIRQRHKMIQNLKSISVSNKKTSSNDEKQSNFENIILKIAIC